MRKRFKVILRIILVLIILIVVTLITLELTKRNEEQDKYKVVDKILPYGYVLADRDSNLFQDIFNKLDQVLEKDEIDYKLYAEYLSELFIIDLFTLQNKENKYDVSSAVYVLDAVRDNFKMQVEDTLYKYVGDSIKKYPVVKNITMDSIEDTTYNYENDYTGYKVILNWKYEEDLGYPNKGEVTIIYKDNKLQIVSFKGVE